MVLIGNNQTNNFFLNGKKVVIRNYNENDDKHHMPPNMMHFVFSYDCNQNAFNFPIFINKYEPSQDEYECINKILENLKDIDKEAIFSKIINDDQSYEWNNPLIRTTIIEYLTKLKSKTYVIGQKNYQQAAYEAFAKKVNIHIIWISDDDEYRILHYQKKIQALDEFERKYGQENIDVDKLKFIDSNDLNKDEKATFKVIKRFLDTFIERFIAWTEEMHDGDDEWYEEDHMDLNDLKNLKIVEGLPSPCSWYDNGKRIGLLERSYLSGPLDELFEEVRGIVLAGTEGITDCEFDEIWNDTMAAEIVHCYDNHHDKKSIKTTKLKAKK